jgi:hypothetical protein
MNEIIKVYIHQTSYKIVVSKLQKVLTYIIHWQMDELPHWHFIRHVGMCANLMWRLVARKLHIIACELHHIYNILYDIGCPLQLVQLMQLVWWHSRLYKYHKLQMSIAIGKPSCKPNCKTLYFFIVIGFVKLRKGHSPHKK